MTKNVQIASKLIRIAEKLATTAKAKPEYITDEMELYEKYPGQSECQDCDVYWDTDSGKLWAASNPEVGNAVPERVWNGEIKTWSLPFILKMDAANSLLDDIADIINTTEDAEADDDDDNRSSLNYAVERRIEKIDSDDQLVILEADDWFQSLGSMKNQAKELGITAKSTEEQLDKIEQKETASASFENAIVEGMDKHFRRIRTYMQEMEE